MLHEIVMVQKASHMQVKFFIHITDSLKEKYMKACLCMYVCVCVCERERYGGDRVQVGSRAEGDLEQVPNKG